MLGRYRERLLLGPHRPLHQQVKLVEADAGPMVQSRGPSCHLGVWPADLADGAFPFGYLHRVLIGQFGMALGELWWLEDLALSCRRDRRYEMFLTAAPINVPGGIGSPASALAIK